MGDLILLSLLPEADEALTSILFEEKALFSLRDEVASLHLSFVDDRQDKAIDQVGSHFLHEVEGKSSSARAVDMQEAYVGIKPYRLESSPYVMSQQGIEEGEQGVHLIFGRMLASSGEGELFVEDEVLE